MITHHSCGSVILDPDDAHAISRLLRRAGTLEANEYADKVMAPTWRLDVRLGVPRLVKEDANTEWTSCGFRHGLWGLSCDLNIAFARKGGATEDEWDLLSTLQMAAIRAKIRTVDIASLKELLNRLGLRYNANDLRTPESTEKERQEEIAAYSRRHGLTQIRPKHSTEGKEPVETQTARIGKEPSG